MVFADLLFLYLFLPLNLILYFCLPRGTARNILLVIFSLIFYAWGEPVWVILLILTAYSDYRHALTINKYRGSPKAKRALVLSLLTDIGIFVVFKYSAFIITNINVVTGLELYVPRFNLPIGISFYTFQTLTYVIDVYRGKFEAQNKFHKYLLYLSMYFQLVAGPIVRYSDVAQSIDDRKNSVTTVSHGIYRFLVGLGKKVIIANTAGTFVAKYMVSDTSSLSTLGAWFGIIMYTLQLYYDFSGYSDMAIGLGHIFGFRFPENFNYPYISKSVSEFWRRWHMTLGSFFRDYVYIPLGGNRNNVWRNLFITWFLTGLWHGASWNFIIWGLYNGAFIMIEKAIGKSFDKIPAILRHIYLLLVVNIGFVFFKFETLSDALNYIGVMFGSGASSGSVQTVIEITNNIFWIILTLLFCTPVMKYIERMHNGLTHTNAFVSVISNTVRMIIMFAILLISTSHLAGNSFNPFLYFQF